MSTNNDELLYDEDDSVKFIQNYLPQELKGKFSNDDINYIVDLIYDFYESNGMLDDDGDDEIEIDEEEVVNYVIKNAQKDGVSQRMRPLHPLPRLLQTQQLRIPPSAAPCRARPLLWKRSRMKFSPRRSWATALPWCPRRVSCTLPLTA